MQLCFPDFEFVNFEFPGFECPGVWVSWIFSFTMNEFPNEFLGVILYRSYSLKQKQQALCHIWKDPDILLRGERAIA